jgi:dUTP pyrophosphatase
MNIFKEFLHLFESKIYIKFLTSLVAKLPTRAHDGDAGLDIFAGGVDDYILLPHTVTKVPTGIAVKFKKGHVFKIENKSSLGSQGIMVMGGIIDHPYTGEISIMLANITDEEIIIHSGQKVAQGILYPIKLPKPIRVEYLPETSRGSNSFGSSGKF